MRRYVVFSVVSLSLLLASISGSAVSVAFPVLISDLDTSLVIAGWVLTGYQLVSTIVMAIAGKVTEVLGTRAAFILNTLLFSIGSVLCAISPNVYLLIGSRVIQAIGGGGFMPCAAGIVSNEFPEERQRYIGLFSSIFPVGMIIGPNLAGWMVEAFGWRSTFWVNVPLGIIVVILSVILLPRGDRKESDTRIDFAGAGLLFGAITSLIMGLTTIGENDPGIEWLIAGILFALGGALLVIFWRWEHRVEEPLIDLELLKEKPFLAANLYNILYGICALGIFSLIPLFTVDVYNLSTLESGIALTPRSVGMIISSTVTSFFLVRWGYRKPILTGTLIVAAGLALLALQPHSIDVLGLHVGTIPLLFVIIGICGIGHGICTPAANNACIELMPDKVATITGLRGMFRQMGSAIGIAIATILLHLITDVHQAYFIVFIVPVIILLLALPTIFIMPASANVKAIQNRSA